MKFYIRLREESIGQAITRHIAGYDSKEEAMDDLAANMPEGTEFGLYEDKTFIGNFQTTGSGVISVGQRQSSLNDQLKELIQIANRHGLYDAADFILQKMKS